MTTTLAIPDILDAEMRAYWQAFGHCVPSRVVAMYVGRPGPLVQEIRQAVALGRPVGAWLAQSKELAGAPAPEWYPRMRD
jgi:hypothetical protein